MNVVWKFPIQLEDEFCVDVPENAEILHVGVKEGEGLFFWAEVNPDADTEPRCFRVFATGQPIESDEWIDYVGTLQMPGGEFAYHFVYHLYEVEDPDEEPF